MFNSPPRHKFPCGYGLVVKRDLAKIQSAVRFRLPAQMAKKILTEVLALAGVILLFLFVSWAVDQNEEYLKSLIYRHEDAGATIYVVLAVVATVVAPLSALPFLPLVSLLYGWFWAAVYSIVGWSIGAWIAFAIARKWGRPLVERLVSLEQIERLEAKIPTEHLFWHIVLLRVVVPVDALSYALGLFSSVKTSTYVSATVIGVTPFAFVWAYAGSLSWRYIALLAIGVCAAYAGYFFLRKKVIHN